MRGANSRFSAPAVSQLLEAKLDFNATGDTSVIAGVAGQTIRIYRIFFVVGANTSIKFKDGATDLTGLMTMLSAGAFVLDFQADPWLTTSAASAFVINQSGTAQISGRVYYSQGVPPL